MDYEYFNIFDILPIPRLSPLEVSLCSPIFQPPLSFLPFYQPLTFFCTVLWPVCPCLHMKNIISLIMNIVIRGFSLRSHLSTSLSYLPFYQSLTFFGTVLWTVLFTYEYHILFDILPITRLS